MKFDYIQCGRARLCRCPGCSSVGTFGWYSALHDAKIPWRWLCKWCGWWWSKDIGVLMCCPDAESGVWEARIQAKKPTLTPMERYERGLETAPYLQLRVM